MAPHPGAEHAGCAEARCGEFMRHPPPGRQAVRRVAIAGRLDSKRLSELCSIDDGLPSLTSAPVVRPR